MDLLIRNLEEVSIPFMLTQFLLLFELSLKNRSIQTALLKNRLAKLTYAMPYEIPMRIVDKSDVLDMISQWTEIFRSQESNIGKLDQAEKTLSTRMIGQYLAFNAIGRAHAEIRASSRPIACFIFCCPTGVGKTKVFKAFAYFFFGSEESMIRIDVRSFSRMR